MLAIVHCMLMLVNTLTNLYIVLPYRCIGLATFICIVTCVILLTFHQNQVHVFLSSQMFFPSLPPHQRQYGHRIYIFHNLQFSVAGCSVFSVIWPKYHIIKDSALRTSYLAVT